MALQNETDLKEVTSELEDSKCVITNGAADINKTKLKKNNNNGEVRFDLGYNIERETVL